MSEESVIHLLDEATCNKIAAGEVVERPASCVKELVENSIDAGATAIEIEIADGGQSYMRVTDNGCGMSAADARRSVIRHATSKISSADDIFAISSLGFRGEAVPSIAAVSHMQMTTRRPADEFAVHLLLDAGVITSEDQAGAPVGTTIEVSDLFYNTPARRKFLKSERTETSKISEMITKLSLSRPDIAFTFTNNGRTTLQTGGGNELKETIANIYGASVAREVFPVSAEQDGITIEGYVGKPSVLKSSRAWQTCIVNGRIVHNPLLFKAIDNAYHAMLPKTGYPFVMMHVRMNPAAIDVNVHPAKTEIKFADEQAVYRVVYHSIVSALVEQEKPENIAKTISLNSRQVHALEAKESEFALQGQDMQQAEKMKLPLTGENHTEEMQAGVLPFSKEETEPLRQGLGEQPRPWYSSGRSSGKARHAGTQPFSPAYTEAEFPVRPQTGDPPADTKDVITFDGDEDVFVPLGAVADCFIVAKKGEDLYIIDQHAAHERIRYDRLCHCTEAMPSQQLLTPEFVEMDSMDMPLLLEQQELFAGLGYIYSEAGPMTLRIEAAPADLPTSAVKGGLEDICRALHEQGTVDKAAIRHRALAYASCRGAIKAGDTLNIRQMKQLLEDLFHTEKPYVCPHGRPVIVRFTPTELAHLFKRS